MITSRPNISMFKYYNVFAAILLLVTIFLVTRDSHALFHLQGTSQQPQHWDGWANVERTLSCNGNSYSDTGFDYDGQQPCSEFSLGNLLYPLGTASDQVNLPVFITTESNQSVVETYNFARVGSPIARGLLPYHAKERHATWNGSTSLFVTFFGMNDVLLGLEQYDKQEIPWLFDEYLSAWASLVDELYRLDARNFLFMNSTPVERMPYGYPTQGPAADYFNACLADKVTKFGTSYPETNVFQFDTHSFFSTGHRQTANVPETALYKNTTKHCLYYAGGTKTKGFSDPSCGPPMRKFLRRDSLHTTWPAHRGIAS